MTRNRAPGGWGFWLGPVDMTLLVTVVGLLGIGLVAVYSATVQQAAFAGNPASWFRRQLMWAGLGVVVMLGVSRVPYLWWRRLAVPLLLATVGLLLAVLVLGQPVFGSRRFLFGPRGQPAEVAKFALVVYAASWLASRRDRLHDVSYGLIPFSVIVGGVAGLVAIQPDLSTAMLLGVIGVVLFFVAGADLRQMAAMTVVGGVTSALLIAFSSHAQERIRQFLAVWRGDLEERTQLAMVVNALQQGGWFGRGPGMLQYPIPSIHNDFILAAIGHAFGLMGLTLVLALFAVLIYRGYLIAAHAPDAFAHFLALGMTTWLAVQALLNAGVTVALLPPTGLTLPFVSYGGSSLVMSAAAVGVLLHLSQYTPARVKRDASVTVGRGHGRTRVSPSERV